MIALLVIGAYWAGVPQPPRHDAVLTYQYDAGWRRWPISTTSNDRSA